MKRKLAKGFVGYEENIALGMVTGLSGAYLLDRMGQIREFSENEYSVLKELFQKFERNIDKDKKNLILSKFTRKF